MSSRIPGRQMICRGVAHMELPMQSSCVDLIGGSSCQGPRTLEFGGGNSASASGLGGWDLLVGQDTATYKAETYLSGN